MRLFILLFTLASVSLISCQPDKNKESSEETWTSIWNGNDLSGWHTYLGPPNETYEDSLGNKIPPFGIDNDPLGVIRVVETDQGNAIRISGKCWDLRTAPTGPLRCAAPHPSLYRVTIYKVPI